LGDSRGDLRSTALALLALLGAMAAFQGGASIATRLFPTVGAEGTAALRLTLGAMMLVALARPWRNWPERPNLAGLIALGACMASAILFFYMALARLPQGVAVALQFLGPLSVAVAASRRRRDLVWAALAATGVWLLVGQQALGGHVDLAGVAPALGAAVGWGGYIVIGRRVGATFGNATPALAVSIAALFVLPVGLLHAGAALFDWRLLPLAAVVAVLTAAIPFSLEFFALRRLPARTFAVFTSLEPVLGVLSGFVLLSQRLTIAELGGVAVVIAAAAGAAWSSAEGSRAAALVVE
jgi:inner membrane transporter RhtA